ASISNFLRDLIVGAEDCNYKVHFVTAREMVNIILAACEGHDGDPGKYRNYRLKAIRSAGENASEPLRTPLSAQPLTGRAYSIGNLIPAELRVLDGRRILLVRICQMLL